MAWIDDFTRREFEEMLFSRHYAKDFNHGTDGHNTKIIIAKMGYILDEVESVLVDSELDATRKIALLEDIMKVGNDNEL